MKTCSLGLFGKIWHVYGVHETQGRGALHCHAILYGGFNLRELQTFIERQSFKSELEQFIDNMYTTHIPTKYREYEVPKDKIHRGMFPIPDTPQEMTDVGYCVLKIYNKHKCSSTCFKNNSRTCRMAYAQPKSSKVTFHELIRNPESDKICPISNPFGISKLQCCNDDVDDKPYILKDRRAITVLLKRLTKEDQLQV